MFTRAAPLALLVLLAWLASSAPASATVGGSDDANVLGYDRSTDAVYFVRCETPGGEIGPAVYRIGLSEPRPRRAAAVPLPRGADSSGLWCVEGPRRPWRYRELAASTGLGVLGRLEPLVRLSDASLTVQGARPCPGCRARMTLSGPRVSRRTIPIIGPPAHARLISFWRVPGRRLAIAMVGYQGVRIEGGYEKQWPVLLGYRPPPERDGRRNVRVRIESYEAGALRSLRLVAVGADGGTHDVVLGLFVGACSARPAGADAANRALECGEHMLHVHARGRRVWVEVEGASVGELTLPGGARVTAIDFAHAWNFRTGRAFEAVCAVGLECRLQLRGRRVARFGAGRVLCSDVQEGTVCVFHPDAEGGVEEARWVRHTDGLVRAVTLEPTEGDQIVAWSHTAQECRLRIGREWRRRVPQPGSR